MTDLNEDILGYDDTVTVELSGNELERIHKYCKRTLPFMRVLLTYGEVSDSYHTEREIEILKNLRLKCRKELIEKYGYSEVYLDSDE